MIQTQTYLKIADNCGAKKIMCIRILGNNRKYGYVGDVFIGVIKKALPNMGIKRSNIVKAIIIRTKKIINRSNGYSVRFDDNAAVIINLDGTPKANRIFGPIAKEVRRDKYFKINSLATELV